MLTSPAQRALPLALLATIAMAPAHRPLSPAAAAPDVRALLQARCTSCHARGGPAPMPLTTDDEIRPWAQAIKEQVLARRMPKWSAAHAYGAFANDPSLTAAEMAAVAAWADDGHAPPVAPQRPIKMSPASAFRRETRALTIPAVASDAIVRTTSRWIAGWNFEPGDPLITSATFTSADGTPIATWTAGDMPVRLAGNAGVHVVPPIRVRIQRRTPGKTEAPIAPGRSVLRLVPRATPPAARIWVERTACGAPRTGPAANLIAVRPLLTEGAAARLWLERPGSPRIIVGWFRDYETRYPRVYWLARPIDLTPESRVAADVPCTLELTLSAR